MLILFCWTILHLLFFKVILFTCFCLQNYLALLHIDYIILSFSIWIIPFFYFWLILIGFYFGQSLMLLIILTKPVLYEIWPCIMILKNKKNRPHKFTNGLVKRKRERCWWESSLVKNGFGKKKVGRSRCLNKRWSQSEKSLFCVWSQIVYLALL